MSLKKSTPRADTHGLCRRKRATVALNLFQNHYLDPASKTSKIAGRRKNGVHLRRVYKRPCEFFGRATVTRGSDELGGCRPGAIR